MRFAPEIHAINLRGTQHPIVTKSNKKARGKNDYLNGPNYGTMADQANNPAMGNLEFGSFEASEGY